MSTIRSEEKLKRELQDKEIRDFFVSDHINIGIAVQVRTIREQRGWPQKKLAQRAGMKQERISAIENPNYKNAFTLSTLVRLASAFDVALIVRFAPIRELVQWELALSHEKLEAMSFEDDPYFKPPVTNIIGSGGFLMGGEGIIKHIYPAEPPQDLPGPQAEPPADFVKYKEARQKELESHLSKFMDVEKRNEAALG